MSADKNRPADNDRPADKIRPMVDASLVDRVLELAIEIQKIPAPTFAEMQRAEFVQARFLAENLQDVGMDDLGNVYARLPGRGKSDGTNSMGKALPVIVSAHLDTVFPAHTDLQVRRQADKICGPGIGDNSLGVAGLFGLVWALGGVFTRQGTEQAPSNETAVVSPLPGDIWLVANVGEEGLGDLRGMRAVVDRFGERVKAYLVLEGMALGQVYHRALGVQRYRITVCTEGGHSWVDYGKPSAVHELARLITQLTSLPIPDRPRTSLNVGMVSGGTSVNTIAAEAHLELDLRSERASALQDLVRRVENLVVEANRHFAYGGPHPADLHSEDVQVSLEMIGSRPAGKITSTHSLVRLAKRCLQEQGIQPNLSIGSTDANVPLSRGLPAVCIGLSSGAGAHTLGECIYIQPLAQGLAQLVALVEGAFRI